MTKLWQKEEPCERSSGSKWYISLKESINNRLKINNNHPLSSVEQPGFQRRQRFHFSDRGTLPHLVYGDWRSRETTGSLQATTVALPEVSTVGQLFVHYTVLGGSEPSKQGHEQWKIIALFTRC